MHLSRLSSRFTAAVVVFFLALSLGAVAARATVNNGEPSLSAIYQAAGAGELARAQRLVDQVIKDHPDSAKAHFVKAELSARQHKYDAARAELATAERLAPGLPFVRIESMNVLREQLALAPQPGMSAPDTRSMGAGPASDAGGSPEGVPWGWVSLAAGMLAIILIVGARTYARNPPTPSREPDA